MEAINIKHLSKLYHLRPSQRDWQRHLDATLHDAMTKHLEPALTEMGIAENEEVCVRLVHVPLSFSLDNSQFDTGVHWSDIIARHIRTELDKGSANVIRYRSRFHALISFAEDISRHTLRRSWAWNQLGLANLQNDASLTQAREQLTESLLREPTAIFPAFIQLAHIQRLDPFLGQLSKQEVAKLFDSIRQQASVNKRWLDTNRLAKANGKAEATSVLINPTTLSKSVIFKHLKNSTVSIEYTSSPLTLREWVVLILLELEPLLFHRSSSVISGFITAVEIPLMSAQFSNEGVNNGIIQNSLAPAGLPREEQLVGEDDICLDTKFHSSHVDSPQGLNERPKNSGEVTEAITEGVLFREQAEIQYARYDGSRDHVRESSVEPLLDVSATKGLEAQADEIATEFAGLFFLLSVLGEISHDNENSLINQIAAEPIFNSRSLSWVLYQLSTYWLAIPTSDPGLRVFCGIDIDVDWPWPGDDKTTDDEIGALEKYAEKISRITLQKLSRTELSLSSIIPHICRRYARMMIDNGWLELVISLIDVDTDIRRVGLDLDPGYVPWLGKVVKIRYE